MCQPVVWAGQTVADGSLTIPRIVKRCCALRYPALPEGVDYVFIWSTSKETSDEDHGHSLRGAPVHFPGGSSSLLYPDRAQLSGLQAGRCARARSESVGMQRRPIGGAGLCLWLIGRDPAKLVGEPRFAMLTCDIIAHSGISPSFDEEHSLPPSHGSKHTHAGAEPAAQEVLLLLLAMRACTCLSCFSQTRSDLTYRR